MSCLLMKRVFFCYMLLLTLTFTSCKDLSSEKVPSELLVMGVTNFADTLEPTDNYFGWVVMRYGIGECLTKFDTAMNTTPWLAESCSLSDDKLTWTFTINSKAQFSNGRKLTAEKVKQSLERVFKKSSRAKTFFTYTDITASENILTITTASPTPMLPSLLADPLFIIIDTSASDRDYRTMGPICTGPYVVESFSKNNTKLKKNPYYWDGEVPYTHVEIQSIDDPTTRAMSLQSGEVDLIVNVGPQDLKLFKNPKFLVSEISSLRTVLARFNVAKGHPLQEKAVREALISASNRKAYCNYLLAKTFVPGKAPVPPSLDYGFDTLIDPNPYNVSRAKKLLEDAGWKDRDGDGYVEKDGKKLELDFIYYSSRSELPLFAEALQADARAVGIKITLHNVDYNILDGLTKKGEYDLAISNIITANTGDPSTYLNWYWKTNTNNSNPPNGSGYSNATFDALSEKLSTEFNPDKRRDYIIQMQQVLMNDSAALFFGYPKTNMVSRSHVQGAFIYPADFYWLTKNIKPVKETY